MMQKYADDFAVFILTHGRPDTIHTLDTLKRGNYTGKWYLVIDNEDKQAERYYERYGKERVIMFDKLAISKTFDTADLSQERRAIVYARNAVFQLAKDMGYDYFAMVDDDVTGLSFRYEKDGKLVGKPVKDFDKVSSVILETMDNTGTDYFSFGTDKNYIGGAANSQYQRKIIDKVYNFIFCRTDQEHFYKGIMNEDEIHNILSMSVGKLVKSSTAIQISMKPVGRDSVGGNAETYEENGYYSYVRNFYPVIAFPVLKLKAGKKGFTFGCDRAHYTVQVLPETLKK